MALKRGESGFVVNSKRNGIGVGAAASNEASRSKKKAAKYHGIINNENNGIARNGSVIGGVIKT